MNPDNPIDVLVRFQSQAQTAPDRIAVIYGSEHTTYEELYNLVQRFASAIYQKGGTHARVLIWLPQGVEAYAAMLGTLMAGGYYAPIAMGLPQARIEKIAQQLEPTLLITHDNSLKAVNQIPSLRNVPYISPRELPQTVLLPTGEPHRLVYIIFTSGSTGEPKGVVIKRNALSKFIEWAIEAYSPRPGDRWAQFSSLGFDLSALDIYAALGGGATLVPVNTRLDRLMPAKFIQKYQITIWQSVPSLIDLMNRSNQITHSNLISLRLMSFCGEPLYPQHLDMLFKSNSQMQIYNTYGPTEGTVFCMWQPLRAENYKEYCDYTVSIGHPIPGWNITLFGGSDETKGEIVIYGDYIGEGYWRNPSITGRAFRQLVISGKTYNAYFSGDWAEYKNNMLFFKYRIDRQVKVHGYRVELDEIDYYLREYGFPSARTIIWKGHLYSFLEVSKPINENDVRTYLSKFLPSYSIPHAFIVKRSLPRNQNQKIDVKALLQEIQKEA